MNRFLSKMEMVNFIENYRGSSFVSIKIVTSPKLNKFGRESGLSIFEKLGINPENVQKFSEFSGGIGYNYEKGITNKLIREGKDPSAYQKGESWHVPYKDSKTIRQHKRTGELYFYVYLNANNPYKSRYIDKSTGTEISADMLKEFLPIKSAPKNQGVEKGNELQVRTLKLDSVKEIHAFGDCYIIG